MRKSILWQLKEYQPKPEPKELIVLPDATPSINGCEVYDYKAIVEGIYDLQNGGFYNEEGLKARTRIVSDALAALLDFKPCPEIGILYPIELAIITHCFDRCRLLICTDETADKIMSKFLEACVDKAAYVSALSDAMDDTSKTLFMARVLLATYGNVLSKDGLPGRFRWPAARYLKCSPNANAAASILEQTYDSRSRILGRIMYFAFWHEHKNEKIYLTPVLKRLTSSG